MHEKYYIFLSHRLYTQEVQTSNYSDTNHTSHFSNACSLYFLYNIYPKLFLSFQDIDGNNIVVINDIRFKGKRSINWREVRAYLKEYVGDFYMVASTGDVIYIGADLPNEYIGSKYTHSLK